MAKKIKLSEGTIEKIKSFICDGKNGKTSQEMYDFLVVENIITPTRNLQNLFHELKGVDKTNASTKVSYFVEKNLKGIVYGRLGGPHEKTYHVTGKGAVKLPISDDETEVIVPENKNCIPERNIEQAEDLSPLTALKKHLEKHKVLEIVNELQGFFKDPGKYNLIRTKELMEKVDTEFKPSHIIEAILEEWQDAQQNEIINLKKEFGI